MEVMQFFLLPYKFCFLQYFCECCCCCSSLKDTRSSVQTTNLYLLLLENGFLCVFCDCCCTCSSLKDTRSSIDVNWLNTMALAEGSACSILCTSSLRASILVLLWKSVVLMRLRMLLFLLLRALTGDYSHRMYRLLLRQRLFGVNSNSNREHVLRLLFFAPQSPHRRLQSQDVLGVVTAALT